MPVSLDRAVNGFLARGHIANHARRGSGIRMSP